VHGIWVMLAVTLALAGGLFGAFLHAWTAGERGYWWAVAAGLPLSAFANIALKAPLGRLVIGATGVEPTLGPSSPVWFLAFALALAPVVEEPVKLLPLALPRVRRLLALPGGRLWTGIALGLGFGLGEAAYVAWGVARAPVYAELPWYAFTGFLGERVIVCLVHGIMTATLLVLAGRGRPVLGVLTAMTLHALVNSTALLYQASIVPMAVVTVGFGATVVGLALLFERMRRAEATPDASADVVYFMRDDDERGR